MSHALIAAPAQPAHIMQKTFRAALTALSEPARAVPVPEIDSPAGASPALWALVLTLLDQDVSVYWPGADETLKANVLFHTGVKWSDTPETADFAVLAADSSQTLALLDRVSVGSHERPDMSATVLFVVGSETTDTLVEGPGLKSATEQRLPMNEALAYRLGQQAKTYPLGFDAYFVDHHTVLGIPRSTRIVVRTD